MTSADQTRFAELVNRVKALEAEVAELRATMQGASSSELADVRAAEEESTR